LHSYAAGTMVTLTAAADSGSSFAGWSGGGCSGTGTCTVTVNSDQTVTATFTANPPAGAPTATVTTPPEGTTYTKGRAVNASYSCSPGASGGVLKPGAAGCSGPVANNSPIDTSTAGSHTFSVTATDTDNQATTTTTHYTVTAPGGGGGGGVFPLNGVHLRGAFKVVNGVVTLGTATNPPAVRTVQTLTATGIGHAIAAKKRKGVVVARGQVTVQSGKTGAITAKLTRRARNLIARRHSLSVTLSLVATGTDGKTANLTRHITLKLATARHHKHWLTLWRGLF
jgi:hypothetical protein